MCVYSMVMNEALKWPYEYWRQPYTNPILEEMLKAAKRYDKETGQPDCELDGKKEALQKIADQLGVKINFPD